MNIEIRPSSCYANCYSLYVNGHIAVSHESMTVCANVKQALEAPRTVRSYSEAAEVADVIRNSLRA